MAYAESLKQHIDALLPWNEVSTRRMFGSLCYFIQGKMFLFLLGAEVVMKLSADDYQEALAQPGVRPFVQTFSTFGTWAQFPMATPEQRACARPWLVHAYAYVKASPAPEPRKRGRRLTRPRVV